MKISDMIRDLPAMKSGRELVSALAVLPEYQAGIMEESPAYRLMALSDLYQVYIPSQMSLEIYSKLYLALLRSLQKKGTRLAVQQQNQNYQAIRQQEYSGILGGSDSFTIIGTSGIGKSSAVSRAISLITGNRLLEGSEPYTKMIPCVTVQCPFDSSVKGLLLEILRKVDEALDTAYYTNALRARATTDMLIGSVSQVALNHIGLLVVDEIQNVVNSKNGKSLVGMLTQLINNSGISICMVGTPESSPFFEQAMQLARRSLGLQYGAMEYGEEFLGICRILFRYQYTRNRIELTESLAEWLYEHSAGIISVAVSLIHDAQEIAILDGSEELTPGKLTEAYQKRMTLLHPYLEPAVKKRKQTSLLKKRESVSSLTGEGERNQMTTPTGMGAEEAAEAGEPVSIQKLAEDAKKQEVDPVALFRKYFPVEEVLI